MFEIPHAKRVRREELYAGSRSATSSPEADVQQLFLERFQTGFVPSTSVTGQTNAHGCGDDDDEADAEDDALEFRLFATPAQSTPAVAKIRVKSPEADGENSKALNSRPRSFYFKEQLSPDANEQLRSVAVTGEQVLAESKLPCPGCRLPWRVTIFPEACGQGTLNLEIADDVEVTAKKRRKGKKARIAIRKKLARDLERQRMAKIAAEDKGLAERMKKAKINRDKKLRQREKEKARKAAARAENG